jgi:hypothetical protein
MSQKKPVLPTMMIQKFAWLGDGGWGVGECGIPFVRIAIIQPGISTLVSRIRSRNANSPTSEF